MPVTDNGHAVLSEQAAGRRQAYRGRGRAADPADEVKLNITKRASASEKRCTCQVKVDNRKDKHQKPDSVRYWIGLL